MAALLLLLLLLLRAHAPDLPDVTAPALHHRRACLPLPGPSCAGPAGALLRSSPHLTPSTLHPPAAAEHKPSEEDADGYMLHSILNFQHLRREAIRAELARLHEEMAGGATEEATSEEAAEEAAQEAEAAEEVKSS